MHAIDPRCVPQLKIDDINNVGASEKFLFCFSPEGVLRSTLVKHFVSKQEAEKLDFKIGNVNNVLRLFEVI